MLQLFVLFYLAEAAALVAGIAGLAINYSAYEAEIYRAGLQAIPAGQMEAALALGMSRWLALRRVIVPQAVRIVIPPVTNDFIALFKDTSVCSVITLVELTKEYSILANSTGGAIEFALAVAVLYMMMSVPLSWFSRWSERRLADDRRERRGAGMIEVDELVQAARRGRGPPGREPHGRSGRGRRDHRAVRRRQEHVPALPERPGAVPVGHRAIDGLRLDADADRPGGLGTESTARSAGGWAWSSRASTCSRTGRRSRT